MAGRAKAGSRDCRHWENVHGLRFGYGRPRLGYSAGGQRKLEVREWFASCFLGFDGLGRGVRGMRSRLVGYAVLGAV